jgi:hypothetical protein
MFITTSSLHVLSARVRSFYLGDWLRDINRAQSSELSLFFSFAEKATSTADIERGSVPVLFALQVSIYHGEPEREHQ